MNIYIYIYISNIRTNKLNRQSSGCTNMNQIDNIIIYILYTSIYIYYIYKYVYIYMDVYVFVYIYIRI